MQEASFRVTSEQVVCLLSGETAPVVDLHGYCDYAAMLQYRLDNDVALVQVSAYDKDPVSGRPVLTMEHIRKVGAEVLPVLQQSLTEEWKAALSPGIAEGEAPGAVHYHSPQKTDYWDRDAKRLRRMESEPAPDSAMLLGRAATQALPSTASL